jgi:branched-subunit amino acid permease
LESFNTLARYAILVIRPADKNISPGKTSESVAASLASEASMDNVKALQSIASSISQSHNPFFSGKLHPWRGWNTQEVIANFYFRLAIIKLFSSRRVTDEALKKQALHTASLLAQVLSGHLV